MFQKMFEKSSYEIYKGCESVIEFAQTKQQREAKNQRLTIVEWIERICDRYWNIEEKGDIEKMEAFILILETSLNPIISNFNEKN